MDARQMFKEVGINVDDLLEEDLVKILDYYKKINEKELKNGEFDIVLEME